MLLIKSDSLLAEFLAGRRLVNPARSRAHGKTDAKLIAHFALEKRPGLWAPVPRNISALQILLRRIEYLPEMRQMQQQRLNTADPTIAGPIKTILESFDRR
jgi:hypothetical protein